VTLPARAGGTSQSRQEAEMVLVSLISSVVGALLRTTSIGP
jgi:hypothetical protein